MPLEHHGIEPVPVADPGQGPEVADTSALRRSAPAAAAARDVDWRDFREHLATAEKDGSRRWLYPKKPSGRLHRHRTGFSWLLLAVMVAGPFVRIRGNPLLMLNIVDRKFSILGFIFWPEDTVIFAVAMLVFLTSIIIFTTAFGRLWCGWACPQTVMMEMVFRKLEWLIEGDGPAARAFDAAPWTWRKAARKALKHGLFLGLSFGVGNLLLSYIIGSDALMAIIRDDPARHVTGLAFMVLFSLLFYAIFARFREQACTFIAPMGAFNRPSLTRTPWSWPTTTSAATGAAHGGRATRRGHARRRGWATASTAANAWPCAPRASTSGTASRWSA